MHLGDGAEKIFLNTEGRLEEVGEELGNLLKYFGSLEPQDAYTREVEEAVAAAREHKEWRREYMKWYLDRVDAKEEGRAEGALANLTGQVCRKMKKDKKPETIAEELEEDYAQIKRIYDVALSYAPDFDIEKIIRKLEE